MPYRIYTDEFEARGRNHEEAHRRQDPQRLISAADHGIYWFNMIVHPTDGRAALEIPSADQWPEDDQANLVESLSADWTPKEAL